MGLSRLAISLRTAGSFRTQAQDLPVSGIHLRNRAIGAPGRDCRRDPRKGVVARPCHLAPGVPATALASGAVIKDNVQPKRAGLV